MTDSLIHLLTIASVIGAALVSGIFFAFSTFIMRALARLPHAHGIAAMQSINIVVLNPWFLGLFFGVALASLAIAVNTLRHLAVPAAAYLIAGAVLYNIGVIGVTIAFNVPRNNVLARADPQEPVSSEIWQRYLKTWTRWNHVRTIAALLAAIAFAVAI